MSFGLTNKTLCRPRTLRFRTISPAKNREWTGAAAVSQDMNLLPNSAWLFLPPPCLQRLFYAAGLVPNRLLMSWPKMCLFSFRWNPHEHCEQGLLFRPTCFCFSDAFKRAQAQHLDSYGWFAIQKLTEWNLRRTWESLSNDVLSSVLNRFHFRCMRYLDAECETQLQTLRQSNKKSHYTQSRLNLLCFAGIYVAFRFSKLWISIHDLVAEVRDPECCLC